MKDQLITHINNEFASLHHSCSVDLINRTAEHILGLLFRLKSIPECQVQAETGILKLTDTIDTKITQAKMKEDDMKIHIYPEWSVLQHLGDKKVIMAAMHSDIKSFLFPRCTLHN